MKLENRTSFFMKNSRPICYLILITYTTFCWVIYFLINEITAIPRLTWFSLARFFWCAHLPYVKSCYGFFLYNTMHDMIIRDSPNEPFFSSIGPHDLWSKYTDQFLLKQFSSEIAVSFLQALIYYCFWCIFNINPSWSIG